MAAQFARDNMRDISACVCVAAYDVAASFDLQPLFEISGITFDLLAITKVV
jgi:hypothetical protein